MGVLTLEVGYTSATTGRGVHEVHKGHVVALGKKNIAITVRCINISSNLRENKRPGYKDQRANAVYLRYGTIFTKPFKIT
jgi:hypothetical protein